MNWFMAVAFLASVPDLVRIADAVADWTRPGRHLDGVRSGHAVSVALRTR